MIKIAPSILSADFANMGKAVSDCCKWGADFIHCDVMDGNFVPNMSFGMKMVKDIKKYSSIPLDVHLMILNPEKYVEEFIKSGADIITIHEEATEHVTETLKMIREFNVKSSISIKPKTEVKVLERYLDYLDMILIMSVEPGFGGQRFIDSSVEKIVETKKLIGDRPILIEVDGGVGKDNIRILENAGVDIAVAGSAVFKAESPDEMIRMLKNG